MNQKICANCPNSILKGKYCSIDCRWAKSASRCAKTFWSLIDKTSSCWTFAGYTYKGYGMIGKRRTHHLAWRFVHGPIPKGLQVLHSCDNRKCCRPSHLFLGTNADNVRDRTLKGRSNRPVGIKNASAKFSIDQVLLIRASDLPSLELAKKFAVNIETIRRIKRRQTYSDVA